MNKILDFKYLRFVLICLVAVLINAAGQTLFLKWDLTRNKLYSLSGVSKTTVSELEETLTIKVFFSENLPQPYNNLVPQMRDLLDDYSEAGNRFFNYSLYTIDPEDESSETAEIKAQAADYGINPINIQDVSRDEVTLMSAYMGMVFLQGDSLMTVPVIQPNENLEYLVTTNIEKLTMRSSRLLSLEEKIEVKLILSSTLYQMGEGLDTYSSALEKSVDELNRKNFNVFTYEFMDPEKMMDRSRLSSEYGLTPMNLDGKSVYANVVMLFNGEILKFDLLQRGLFGYQMAGLEELATLIEEQGFKMVGTNHKIGYLAGHGTLPLYNNPYVQSSGNAVQAFYSRLSEFYDIESVYLDQGIPEGISSLVVASPSESFTDWELFQLDQFLMKGNSLIVYMDTHNEIIPDQQQMMFGQMPQYTPRNTNLEKLLTHYGITVENSYVFDEDCFINRSASGNGGYAETPIYYAPRLMAEDLDQDNSLLKQVKGLVMLNVSPLTLAEESEAKITPLLSTSDKSWVETENFNLYNPTSIFPPSEENRSPSVIAATVSGSLVSYFKGRELPSPPQNEEDESLIKTEALSGEQSYLESGSGAGIFVMGTSSMLSDSLFLDQEDINNSLFVLNTIDTMSGRADFADMRGKGQNFEPLAETDQVFRTFTKTFNIIVLPVLVIGVGLIVFFYWISRKKRIQVTFTGGNEA